MAVSLTTLLVQQTKAQLYALALTVAASVGVDTSTWQAGDPTRSLFHVEAEELSTLEAIVVQFIASGFLDYATGDWLKILAEQVYGVTVPEATYASTTVTLTNAGGGVYTIEANDLTFKCSATGKTYHNTTGGTLASGPATTLNVTVEADEAGSESSAGATEIDELVTTLLGVTCSNATAAVGTDEQAEATTRQQCRDKLGSLSPNGPSDAYAYVARNSTLTGTTEVTRVRVYPDSNTGDVQVYLAGAGGAVGSPVVTAVEAAIVQWSNPLCNTPAVASASAVTVDVTYALWVYESVNKTSGEIEAAVEAALEEMFAARPIGGDILTGDTTGSLFKSMIESTIRSTFPQAFRCTVSAPSGDTALTNGQVAALGSVSPTIHLVTDPS
jgi:uncharacterized phage protein gp47/JayE